MTHDHQALFLAAHPDDAEVCCAGTILRLVESDQRVAVVDMTRGEMGSKGTAETRAAECAKATQLLGVAHRSNLGLPDSGLKPDDDDMVRPVVRAIRSLRPRLLFTQHETDLHPDHTATALIGKRAYFLAGLVNFEPELGPPYRPDQVIRFPANDHVEPTFCIDISDLVPRKRAAIECYATQVSGADRAHFAKKLDPLERCMARDAYYGAQLGCRAAEPFVTQGPLLLQNFDSMFGS